MAPKRQKSSPKVVSAVVRKTTKKVVRKETVRVATVGIQEEADAPVATISVTEKGPSETTEMEETIDVATFKEEAPVTPVKEKEAEAGDKANTAAPEEEEEEDQREEEADKVPRKLDAELENTEGVPAKADAEKDSGEKKTEKAPLEKKAKGSSDNRGRRRVRRKRLGEEIRKDGYRRYVFKVLKQVHPGMAVSSRAMTVLDGFMSDMFERLAGEAARLSKYSGRRTLSSREVQSAVRLVLPGELGKHAIAEGTKAVSNYMGALHST